MRVSLFNIIRKKMPRTWWLLFIPTLVLYGSIVYLVISWCNYRADAQDLARREAIAEQKQEEAARIQRYKNQLTAPRQTQFYDVRNAVDQ